MAQINLHNFSRTYESRIEDILTPMLEYFIPTENDLFKIIDPYFEPMSIQDSFISRKYEDKFWPFLISMLSDESYIKVKIITRQKNNIISYVNANDEYPYRLYYPDKTKDIVINICSFCNKSYNDQELHDRWILKIDAHNTLKGLHIGCSLDDIRNKDVTITYFSQPTLNIANERFDFLWNICLRNKW